MNYLPMLSKHHIDLRSEVVTVSTFQGRCCLPGLGERSGVTERLWTQTRWAIRGRRNMRRRRGRGGNLGLARDCSRSCVIKFCDERQVKFKYVKLLRNVSVKCHSYHVIISDDLRRPIRPPFRLQELHPQTLAELRDRGGGPQPHAAPLHHRRVA